MGNFKKMIFGEKMPDRDDPKYQKQYEKDVESGRKFCKATGLDRLAARVQGFATRHSKLFLVIVFGFVIACFSLNIYHMVRAYRCTQQQTTESVSQRQERILLEQYRKSNKETTENNGMDKEN